MLLRTVLLLPPGDTAHRVDTLLDGRDLSVVRIADPEDVWPLLQTEEIDLLLTATEHLAGPADAWVASIRALPDPPALVLFTGAEDGSRRATLLGAGATAVLSLAAGDRELRQALQTLMARIGAEARSRLAARRAGATHGFEGLVARSPAMQEVVALGRRVAGADSPLLIQGETGVGKERVARAVHHESRRAPGPFVAVNCGAIPEGLLESELFGHERGAFTGAARARRGHFEMAHGGTLFLDEIGELPLHLQVKLLRVLEDRSVQRLGSEEPVRVDARILAATNRDLQAEVEAGRFRADLYYRLAVVSLTLPPLRDRTEDIPDLVEAHLDRLRGVVGRSIAGVSPEAMAALAAYRWPGNVRELLNVLERAALLATDATIGLADLPRVFTGVETGRRIPGPDHPDAAVPLTVPADALDQPVTEARHQAVLAFEKIYLSRLLREERGRIGDVARRAGISERSLYDLMRRNGLDKADFRG
ncbi:MAG: sigma 54-interacting transcriptional regulator [Longimicrobiales bacterium]